MNTTTKNYIKGIFATLVIMLATQGTLYTPTAQHTEKMDYTYLFNWLNRARENGILPIKIESYADIVNLFDISLKLIYEELCLEECPVNVAYSDGWNGATTPNTLGLGSTYALENINDYNNPDAVWVRIKDAPEKFVGKTYSYEDMLKLIIGWAKYRTKTLDVPSGKVVTNKTVLEHMFEKLQGAELTPNEFSAIFCAVYNSPDKNLKGLCSFISENYQDKIKCANKIMNWTNADAFTPRCINETLFFLNTDGYCNTVENMTNTKRGSCINVPGLKKQKITSENYVEYSNYCKDKFLAAKTGTKIKDTEQGLEKYFKDNNKKISSKPILFTYNNKAFSNR